MYSYEICSCIFESLTKLCKEWIIFPSETSFYWYWNTYCLRHFFHYFICRITIDHERWSMSAFYDFFCRTSHIDIDASNSISLDDFCSFSKFFRIFPEDLDNKRVFTFIMGKRFFLEIFRMDDTISRIKFWEDDCLRRDFFHDLSIWAISIAVHRSESRDWSLDCEIFPKVFIHRWVYIENRGKIQSFFSWINSKWLSSSFFFRFFLSNMVDFP